ncbi:hypothetical protein ACFRJ1_05520 [Streptomyces sp. NPDC056773]|uniref:hypothetical protein n=1 Tax=unclassified Streptomyces TaxID=2593676 RepID=UPI00367F953D
MTEHDVLDFPGADGVRAASDVAPPSARAVDAALAAVRAAVAAEATEVGSVVEAVPRRAAVRRRRFRRLLVSAAAVAVIATGVAVYPVVGRGPAATATAAEFLREVAATANERSLPQAPYWKVRSRMEPSSQITTSWIGRNRSVGQNSEASPVMEFAPPEVFSWRFGEKDITWDDLPSLPTNAQDLRTRLTGGDAIAPDLFFNGAANLLSRAPLEPAVRGALFEALADTPGITLVGPVKDTAGRTGTAVEMRSDTRSWRLVLDPATGVLLEYRVNELGGPEGDRLAFSDTYLSAEPAWSIPPTVSMVPPTLTPPVLKSPQPVKQPNPSGQQD